MAAHEPGIQRFSPVLYLGRRFIAGDIIWGSIDKKTLMNFGVFDSGVLTKNPILIRR